MKKVLLSVLLCSMASFLYAEEATITSDELELQDNGALTIFTGHVVLRQTPYDIRSWRMVRTKETGIVSAKGNVIGTWVSPKNETIRVFSDEGAYDPSQNVVEVWGKKQVKVTLDEATRSAYFFGDRGWVYTETPGKAKLIGNVTGHVVPQKPS